MKLVEVSKVEQVMRNCIMLCQQKINEPMNPNANFYYGVKEAYSEIIDLIDQLSFEAEPSEKKENE